MIHAVLFDVYETLIETPLYRSPYSYLIRELKITPEQISDASLSIMTHNLGSIEETAAFLEGIFPGFTVPPATIRQAEEELAEHLSSFRKMDGLEEMIMILRNRGYLLGLVSNVSSPYKEPIARLGIESLVDHYVYSCDCGFAKPDPRIFEMAIERMNLSRSSIVMVGDDPDADIAGARSVGLRAILLNPEDIGGISLSELPQYLLKIDRTNG